MNYKNSLKISLEKTIAVLVVITTVAATFFAVVNSTKALAQDVDQADASLVSIQKTVMNVTQNTAYSEQVDADFGDTVKFSLVIENVGHTQLTDLKVNDLLPNTLTYKAATLHLAGGHIFHGDLFGSGLLVSDLDNYGDSMTITFEATVANASQFADGETIITNEATVIEKGGTPGPSRADLAKVRVFKAPTTQCVAPEVDDNVIDMANGTVGQSFSYDLRDNVLNGSEPMTFTLANNQSLPAGLSISNGVLSGTPTEATTTVVKFFATNSCGRADFRVELTIDAAPAQCTAPVVDDNTIETVNGTVGQSLSYNLSDSVHGGSQPMTFTVAGTSSLPDGITLNNGVISGTPTVAGTHIVKFFVENSCGRQDFQVRIDVINGSTQCVAPEVDDQSIGTANGSVGYTFSYNLAQNVSAGSRPITFTLVHSSLPGGLSINGDFVTGTPTVEATTTLNFFVENACGREDFKVKFIIGSSTTHVNTPPTITLIGANPLEITVNTNFVDPGATATDTEDGDLTSQIVKSGMVNASTTGTYVIHYSVTDSGGLTASTSRTVIVNPVGCGSNCGGGGNTPPVITLIGDNPPVILLGNNFTDPGATATDAQDGDLTSQIVVTGTVSTSTISTSTVKYTVTDSGGLSASTTRTVIVRPAACSDGRDNDGDGKIDSSDPGCHTDKDPNNTSSYVPTDDDETDTSTPSNPPTTTTDDNGGGGGGGRRRDISNLITGEILGATSCSYLKDYLKIGWQNDPVEVLKMQSFLNVFEKENLSLNGVFDQATFEATERFQNKYFDDILKPWGHTAPTGFVYILTKKKVNEIYCNTIINLSAADQQEIISFRSYLQSLGSNGAWSVGLGGAVGTNTGSSKNVLNDVLKNSTSTATTTGIGSNIDSKVSVVRNAAISLFSLPQKWFNLNQCGNISLLVLLALLILIVLVITLLIRSRKPRNIVGTPIMKDSATGSPVIVLPGVKEDKDEASFSPDEEIIIEDPEEASDDIVNEKTN